MSKIPHQNKILLLSEDGKRLAPLTYGDEEIVKRPMKSNNENGVVLSSSGSSGSNREWNAFDNVNTSYWQTEYLTTSGYLQIYKEENSSVLVEYAISTPSGGGVPENRAPNTWELLGSNNKIDWSLLDSQSNETSWSKGEKRRYHVKTANAPYKYYRLKVIKNDGDASFLTIGSFELFVSPLSKLIEISNQHYINQDISQQELSNIDFSSDFTEKHYINSQSIPLGSGKVFEQPLDVDKVVKRASIK